MNSAARAIVLGATGFTGQLVARELASRRAAPLVLAGRSATKLARLAEEVGSAEVRVADALDPASLSGLARRGDVVINCAGPFTDLGEPVVAAAVEGGAHYLDATGEQAFMARVYERWNAPAQATRVSVVNAMAFEYALGGCAAASLAEGLELPLRAVDVTYVFRVGAGAASAGTRRSVLRILAAPSLSYVGGRWRSGSTGAMRRAVELPGGRVATAVSFPAGEVLSLPRHLSVETVRGWAVVGGGAARLLRFTAPLLPPLVRLIRPLAERAIDRRPEGPSEAERRASDFVILVDAEGAEGSIRRAIVRGGDPYGLTGVIMARAALRVIGRAGPDGRSHEGESPPPPPAGVIGPEQLVEPRSFLDGLRDAGIEWEIRGG